MLNLACILQCAASWVTLSSVLPVLCLCWESQVLTIWSLLHVQNQEFSLSRGSSWSGEGLEGLFPAESQ